MKPHYDPGRWPMTVHFVQDKDELNEGCREFPERLANQVMRSSDEYYTNGSSAFCWSRGDAEGRTYIKTIDNCYIPRELAYETDDSPQANSLDELPSCGPLRKWMYTNINPCYIHEVGKESTVLSEWQQWQDCWLRPDKKAPSVKVNWYYPHVACWVNGTTVDGEGGCSATGSASNVWFEASQRLKTGENCYFPHEAVGSPTLTNTVGEPSGPCPKDGVDV
ncbi:hypothetical protein BJ875DRAFT_515596 [Amylocarpus encephaloides]|uniref:Uncharacterized protein n=1 Tax=Amylocarpus encephaloides TaxID=45428 RepID=A0A9P8C301_9HELO|nr:hypothetical protein BJ875DRAFT_515596 [Amylocarpus encephaloides]